MAEKAQVKNAVDWYRNNKEKYKKLSIMVKDIIKEMLINKNIYYHSIASRAKKIESFQRKAKREKYTDPINQITDLAGIRIITLFEKDVYEISDLIKDKFIIDYKNSEDKADLLEADKMGYKSVHYIGTLTDELVGRKKYEQFKNLKFEIQIRSILQHAWAEIEHDRNYKLKGNLPKHLQRRFYALSGMLEMADREFNLLAQEVDEYKEKVKELTRNGEIEIKLNPSSLKKYLLEKFREEVNNGIIEPTLNGKEEEILRELDNYGLWDLVNLDSIIPANLNKILRNRTSKKLHINFITLVKLIMIINDHRKYFEKVAETEINFIDKNSIKILSAYDVPIKKLSKEYKFEI